MKYKRKTKQKNYGVYLHAEKNVHRKEQQTKI